MRIKAIVILLMLLLADRAFTEDGHPQPSPTPGHGIQDVATDSVHNVDTIITAEIKQQTFVPDTGSEFTPPTPSTKMIKKPWPTGALFRSAIIPGWGQVYNKQYIKAVIYGGTEIALAYTTSHYWKQMDTHQKNFMNSTDRTYQAQEYFYYQNSRDNRNLFLWLTGLTFFISIFDAYVDAHFADYNVQDKAFEAYLAPKNDGLYLSLNFTLK